MASESPANQLKALLKDALKAERPTKDAPSEGTGYHQKPALQNAFWLGGQSAIAGGILAGLRNALSGTNVGFLQPIGLFSAVGATFAMTEAVVANQRGTDDSLNGAAGACAAGFLLGLRARSLPMAVGSCTIMGGMMGMYDYTIRARRPQSTAQNTFFKPTAVVEAVKA